MKIMKNIEEKFSTFFPSILEMLYRSERKQSDVPNQVEENPNLFDALFYIELD